MVSDTPMLQALVAVPGVQDHAELVRAGLEHCARRLNVQGWVAMRWDPFQSPLSEVCCDLGPEDALHLGVFTQV